MQIPKNLVGLLQLLHLKNRIAKPFILISQPTGDTKTQKFKKCKPKGVENIFTAVIIKLKGR